MTEPRELTIFRAAQLMRRGELTAEALTASCLDRINFRDADVRAWVLLDAEGAMALARQRDLDAREQRWHGPMHGIPIGIKDIIDVAGWPTRGGTDVYPPSTPEADADAVEILRRAGAIILGKTVTTAMAYLDPADTRNPWNLEHTPGGSSSGSGAAVADRMCLAALGTQTGGSVIRPAAYNGIVGFKPSFATISLEGVLPAAWQFDTLGTFSRDCEDANLLWNLLRRDRKLDWQKTREKMPQGMVPKPPRRIWRMRDYFLDEAQAACTVAIDSVCGELEQRGVEVIDRPLPPSFEGIHDAHMAILSTETASYNRVQYAQYRQGFPPKLAELIEHGLARHAVDYVAARFQRERFMRDMAELLSDVDAALMPATPSPAPKDLTQTGSAAFNSPWSLCGIPALTVPVRLSDEWLPVGAQLITRQGDEDGLLSVGRWMESLLNFSAAPK